MCLLKMCHSCGESKLYPKMLTGIQERLGAASGQLANISFW